MGSISFSDQKRNYYELERSSQKLWKFILYSVLNAVLLIGVSTPKNINVFFDATYHKCASMSSDVSITNIKVFENRILFLTLHQKAYNLI